MTVDKIFVTMIPKILFKWTQNCLKVIHTHTHTHTHTHMMQILASRTCCGCNIQIHTDYRNLVEEKGWHGHSLKKRAPRPLP